MNDDNIFTPGKEEEEGRSNNSVDKEMEGNLHKRKNKKDCFPHHHHHLMLVVMVILVVLVL
eukprot:2979325-Ditylum_brightwellii.AAC.1